MAANGGKMPNLGEKKVHFLTEDNLESNIVFQVTHARKALASVSKIVRKGNKVIFTPNGSHIENIATGERMKLRVERGTYVFDVKYHNGEHGSITLDSGAGASCWPVGMMQDVEMEPKQPGIKFRAANGEELKYFGRKSIGFRPVGAESGKNECNMKFHVTNTTKPLASAMAVVNAGNRVVLTKEPGGSYIENIATKRRIKLKEVGGTFVFDVEGGRKVGSSGFKRRA